MQPFKFDQSEEELLKRRVALAKQQGMSDQDISHGLAIEKAQARQQEIQRQIEQRAQDQKKTEEATTPKVKGIKRFAINAGAMLGSAAAGVGALAAAPVTGGASLAGGVAAGAGIEALRRKLLGEKQSLAASAVEGGLTLLPGAAKGLKAVSGARKVAKVAEVAASSPEKETLKQALINSVKSTPQEGIVSSRINRAGEALKAEARGVKPSIKPIGGNSPLYTKGVEDVSNTLNNVERGKTITGRPKLGTQGSATKQLGQIEQAQQRAGMDIDTAISSIKKPIATKNLQKARDESLQDIVGKNGRGVLEMKPQHNKIVTELDNKISEVKTAEDALALKRNIQGKIKFNRDSQSPDLTAEKVYDVYRRRLDGMINDLSPDVKKANTKYSKLENAKNVVVQNTPSNMKQAGNAGPSSRLLNNSATQALVDKAGRDLTTVAKVTSNPVVKTVAGQEVGRAAFKPADQMPVAPDTLPENPSELFPGTQDPSEQALNIIASQGITDPQEQYDALVGQGKYAGGGDQGADTSATGGLTSADLLKQAYDLRMAGDSKGAKDVLEFAKVAAAFEKQAGAASGTKVSANQQKDLSKLGTAENVINEIEKGLGSAGLKASGPEARISGVTRNIGATLGTDSQSRVYKSQREGYVASLAKSLGEVGSLSDTDKKAAIQLIPSLGDTQAEAQEKLRRLRALIASNKETILSVPQTTGGFDDVNSMFSNAQGAY